MQPKITRNAPVRRVAARQRLDRIHQKCEQKQRRRKKASGLLIAGASVAALMGIAFLKGRADTGAVTERTTEPATE